MTALDAMVYCLGFVDADGHSQTVYDRHGDPHWFGFLCGVPKMCSESPVGPFVEQLQPYSMSKHP